MDVTANDPRHRPRVVIVENDHPVRRSIQFLLQARGYDVKAFASGVAVLADDATRYATCLIASHLLEDVGGIALLRALRERGWMEPAILVTASLTPQLAEEARDAGFSEVLEKPLKPHVLNQVVDRLVPPRSGE